MLILKAYLVRPNVIIRVLKWGTGRQNSQSQRLQLDQSFVVHFEDEGDMSKKFSFSEFSNPSHFI